MTTVATPVTIDRDSLLDVLKDMNKATIATVEAITEPKMNKRGNPLFGRVKKHAIVNGVMGWWNYTNSVNNQRQKEANPQTIEEAEAVPEFIAHPRSWGVRVPKSALVEYQGRHYVEIKCNWARVNYLVDGRAATPEEIEVIKAFTPKKKEGTRQEVENPIILRDYGIETIQALTLEKEWTAVED